MKALLINATDKTVTPVEYNGDYRTIYDHIGCELFDVVYAEVGGHKVSIFVDDEGLLNAPQAFFLLPGWPQPLAGNALVLGDVDEEGETLGLPDEVTDIPGLKFLNIAQAIAFAHGLPYERA